MSLNFGTSGIRGLNSDFSKRVVNDYITSFVNYAQTKIPIKQVVIASDLRESSPGIIYLIKNKLRELSCDIIDCGFIPTPNLAYFCIKKNTIGIMVTGSHIPADRNGIKFYWPWGEILKEDEVEIKTLYDKYSSQKSESDEVTFFSEAQDYFIRRYLNFFSPYSYSFKGKKIVIYQHSTVTRDLWKPILMQLGFEVTEVGRSNTFIPIDTETNEAVKALNDIIQPAGGGSDFFAVVSSDGDGDRPFLCDEKMNLIRGDTIGLLSSIFLNADAVVTPISSNTNIEKSNSVKEVIRTKIGSPFVIEGMSKLMNNDKEGTSKKGTKVIIGYEANGGLLLGTDVVKNDKVLEKLPTRDSILPVLCCLALASERKIHLSDLVATLPNRFTESGVLRGFCSNNFSNVIKEMNEQGSFKTTFISKYGKISDLNELDGIRVTFSNGDTIHFRPSGNAPEFRCYTESSTIDGAKILLKEGIQWLEKILTN